MKFATWFSAAVGEIINIHVLTLPEIVTIIINKTCTVAMLLVASQLPQFSSGI
jgi:hypothetical protein